LRSAVGDLQSAIQRRRWKLHPHPAYLSPNPGFDHVQINLRRRQVLVPQQFLYGPNGMLQKVLAHGAHYDLAIAPGKFWTRVKRMNTTIDLRITAKTAGPSGSKFNISRRGEL
jgi:hypothetical protein